MLPTPKTVCVFSASATNGATNAGTVDCRGYAYAVIDTIETASNNVTNNCSVLRVGEGDTSTAFTNISGLVGDTDFTIPPSVTSGVQALAQMRIDLRGRKRYLQLSASPVTTQVLTGIVHLYRGDEAPVSAADANAGVVVAV